MLAFPVWVGIVEDSVLVQSSRKQCLGGVVMLQMVFTHWGDEEEDSMVVVMA